MVLKQEKGIVTFTQRAKNRANALKLVAEALERRSGGEGESYYILISPAYESLAPFWQKREDELNV